MTLHCKSIGPLWRSNAKRPGIHFRLGRVLLAQDQSTNGADRQAEALSEFTRELQHDPTNANAAYEIAEIHRKAGDIGNARTFFETALKHYPDFEEALVGLGRSLIAQQQPKLAIPYLTKAISLNAKNEVADHQLAQAQQDARRCGSAGEGAGDVQATAQRVRARNDGDTVAPGGHETETRSQARRGSAVEFTN